MSASSTTVFISVAASLVSIVTYRALSRKRNERDEDLLPSSCSIVYRNNPIVINPHSIDTTSSDIDSQIKDVVRSIVPEWRNISDDLMQIKIICGGITNLLYRVDHVDHESVLVRVYGENTDVLIDRERENWIFAELSKSGYAPTYYGRFSNGRVEGYLESMTLTPEVLSQESPINYLKMNAKEFATLHCMNIKYQEVSHQEPVLWKMLQTFEDLAMAVEFPVGSEKHSEFQKLSLLRLRPEIEWLKTVLPSKENEFGAKILEAFDDDGSMMRIATAFMNETVFCHNDGLAGNILYSAKWNNEEGSTRLIDYEYGGENFRGFDFANHFCEHAGFDCDFEHSFPSFDTRRSFMKYYLMQQGDTLLKDADDQDRLLSCLVAAVDPYTMASHLFWALWAVVQAKHSPLSFNFLDYARLRLMGYYYHKGQWLENDYL